MHTDDSKRVRSFLGWVALVLGAFVGWGLVELAWRHINQGIHWHIRPERGWGYAVIALMCSLSIGFVGLGLMRFRELPDD